MGTLCCVHYVVGLLIGQFVGWLVVDWLVGWLVYCGGCGGGLKRAEKGGDVDGHAVSIVWRGV